jgi:rare lipoprotein A
MRRFIMFAALVAVPILAALPASANTMVASWYGEECRGNRMANGYVFWETDSTVAAHKSLPFGTKLELTNSENGRTHTVVVQDRGPYIEGRDLDLSKAAAQKLGYLNAGTATLWVRIIHRGSS